MPLIAAAELARGHADDGLERAREIALVVVADLEADLRAVLLGREEQVFGVFYAHAGDVFDDGDAHLVFEDVGEARDAQVGGAGDVGQRHGLVVVGVNVVDSRADLADLASVLGGVDQLDEFVEGGADPGAEVLLIVDAHDLVDEGEVLFEHGLDVDAAFDGGTAEDAEQFEETGLEDAEVAQIVEFIRQNALALLGFAPEIFAVSARLALKSKQAESGREGKAIWQASRFDDVETYIHKTLDQKSRIRLKLHNPLGVGQRLVGEYRELAQGRLELLGEDVAAIGNIESQLEIYRHDMQRDFHYRMADVENVLLEMENRGVAYFDDTLRLARVLDLINTQRIQGEFERHVVGDAPTLAFGGRLILAMFENGLGREARSQLLEIIRKNESNRGFRNRSMQIVTAVHSASILVLITRLI